MDHAPEPPEPNAAPDLVPDAVRSLVGNHGWLPHPGPGLGWDVGNRQVYRADGEATAAHLQRRNWLADRFPVNELTLAADEWLVATSDGSPANRPDRQPVPDEVPALVGAALRRLHELDLAECPFSTDWPHLHGTIAEAEADGRLDAETLPNPYNRYSPERLLELIVEGRPQTEDLVVAHGNPVLPNLFFDQGALAGTTGLQRLGSADRHLDLAIAHRSMQSWFGGEAVFGLYQGYGADPDLVRLDHFVLLDVVLGAITPKP